mgnify:CR=1 FL=1
MTAGSSPDRGEPELDANGRAAAPRFVVGVGASAGGLEALETLLQAMPADTGLAFVVVQHLSPDHKSHMLELLGRHTTMPVEVATDGLLLAEIQRVKPVRPRMLRPDPRQHRPCAQQLHRPHRPADRHQPRPRRLQGQRGAVGADRQQEGPAHPDAHHRRGEDRRGAAGAPRHHPRRRRALPGGLELRARKQAESPRKGLEVVRVTPEGAGARAGVCPGDWIELVNEHVVSDARDLVSYVRTLPVGAPLVFAVDRHGETLSVRGEMVALPVERLAHADVQLGQVQVGEHRRRVLWTIPRGFAGPHPTILYLSGLGTQSCELSEDPDEPLRHFLEGLSRAGFATLRVERSGVGDSEGPPLQTTNLFDDVTAYRAALDLLARSTSVRRVLLFGHSVGGMIAPLLAGDGSIVRGVMVFGTSALRWVDCIVRATRRQKQLAGMAGEELETYVAAWQEMHIQVCRNGLSPATIFDRDPHFRWLEGSACRGETMFGRHVQFFQQLERLDLAALWKTVAVPVLVMHGEFDWACGPDEGKALADAIAEVDPARITFTELAATGHDMRRHVSIEESYANPRRGVWDGGVVSIAGQWLREIEQ